MRLVRKSIEVWLMLLASVGLCVGIVMLGKLTFNWLNDVWPWLWNGEYVFLIISGGVLSFFFAMFIASLDE